MTLRDYQIDIADRANKCLKDYGIAYLAMETRTGKTITAFEAIKRYGAHKVLFVTKKKAIKSIENDYNWYKDHFDCTIINYESVSKVSGPFDLLVCDEAHSLGAFPKPAKRVIDLMRYSYGIPVIFMSATPTPESYSQIYHQLYVSSFSPFRDYKNFYKWAKDYVDKRIKYVYNREVNDYSHAMVEKITPMINNLFFTQTQVDSGFESLITEKVIYCDMGDIQKQIIDCLIKDKVCEGKSGAIILADTAVKLQSKVHQVCSGTVKDEDGNSHVVSYEKALTIRKTFAGQRVAVFYKFKAELDALKKVFPDFTESPEVFQAGISPCFFGQFQSAREGIRLDKADAIIFYNIDFSYLSYAQAKNRIVSKERSKSAVLYWLFTRGGIEEKIYKVVVKKKDYTTYYFKRDFL